MIIFDAKSGRFRDTKGGFRSDVSGLLSSHGRRTLKKTIGKKSLADYRNKLGKEYYKKSEKPQTKRKKKRGVYEETTLTDLDEYLKQWMDEYSDEILDEDTDLDTP